MMATFCLSSTTIVYDGDEVPDICYTDQWVLCISSQVEKSDQNVFEYNTKSNEATTEGGSLFCASVGVDNAYEGMEKCYCLCNNFCFLSYHRRMLDFRRPRFR